MYKLFVFALVFGLCASVPLRMNESRLTSEENVGLESALLIPEFEIETNRTVLLETMPEIMQVVEEKIMNATLKMKEMEKELENATETTTMESTTTTMEFNTTMESNITKRAYDVFVAETTTPVPMIVPTFEETTTVAYGGYETTPAPMATPVFEETTTVAYGGYEATPVPMVVPTFEETTTVAYGGYETTPAPMATPVFEETTTVAYETTTVAYETTTESVPQFTGVVSSGYKKREAPVRTIMDKITIFIQEKHSNMAEYIAKEYCTVKSDETNVFQYYKPYPNDQTRYVVCDTWGRGTVRECSEGRLWDQFYEVCSVPSVIEDSQNMTRYMEELSKLQVSESCNSTLYSCINGGECVEREAEWECVCPRAFTGPYCQFRVEEGSIFSAIMTNTFNYTKFEEFAIKAGLNDTLIRKDMKSLREYTNTTMDQIMQYVDMFGDDQVRYDTALNLLIEEVLEDIYPDLYYMSIFNVSENSLLHVVRTIPAMVSYSRYATERYTEVLAKYTDALDRLMFTLNSSIPNAQEVATEYTRIVAHINNETMTMDFVNKTSQAQVEQGLDMNFNKTTEQLMEFSVAMNSMRSYFIQYMRDHPESVDLRVGMLPLTDEVKELISVFDAMTIQSIMLINQLFNFGFWEITEALAHQL